MSPILRPPLRIAPRVLQLRAASCFGSSPPASHGAVARALVSEGGLPSLRNGGCARGYSCAGTISARAAAAQPVRSSPGAVVLGRRKNSFLRRRSSGNGPRKPRTWLFDEMKDVVDGVRLARFGKITIVDVREPSEIQETGVIPGAINIPSRTAVASFNASEDEFREMHQFERPSRDKYLLFYCKAGIRAQLVANEAGQAGWHKRGVYPGSWDEWEAKGGPVERK
ncbi:hypothetical protein E4U21_007563 [Claviceps maximensis]|nr:hypothetical protein E4U21_007563 [Claviceps maximensis]